MNIRLKIFFGAIVLSFITLIGGLLYTQVLRGEHYRTLSEQNRIIVVPLNPPRGKIYDRKNRLLVDNKISFDLSFIYKNTKDIDRLSLFLSSIINIDKEVLIPKMLKAKSRPYTPARIVEDIGREEAIILEQYRIDYPEILITTRPKRHYPYEKIASSVIGYLGKISEEELFRRRTYGYRITDLVGKSGLEKRYDTYLRGKYGGMQVEIDAFGRQSDILHIKEPQSGKPIYLTIDLDLQKYCDSLMEEKRGSIIAMNPNNGEILAFVSKPNFNPAIFLEAEKDQEIERIFKDPQNDYPLLNRGISGSYPPGSIFKIAVATAALESKRISPSSTFECRGYFEFSKNKYRCWKEEGHGVQPIEEAIKNSCNVFFYQLGLKTGVENIWLYAKKFDFGKQSGIDLPGEINGLVPNPEWKRSKESTIWYPGDTVNYSIGQGYLLLTPIQVIRMMSVFANGGYLVKPYLVERIDNVKISNPELKKIDISDETINTIRNAMKKVVNDPRGTGMKARMKDIIVAGKTGTAQNPEGKAHGWFSGFAPFHDPKICVIAFVEFGGKGGLEASIIARKVIEKSQGLGLL